MLFCMVVRCASRRVENDSTGPHVRTLMPIGSRVAKTRSIQAQDGGTHYRSSPTRPPSASSEGIPGLKIQEIDVVGGSRFLDEPVGEEMAVAQLDGRVPVVSIRQCHVDLLADLAARASAPGPRPRIRESSDRARSRSGRARCSPCRPPGDAAGKGRGYAPA